MSAVVLMSAWPRIRLTSNSGVPSCSSSVAAVWRRVWNLTRRPGIPPALFPIHAGDRRCFRPGAVNGSLFLPTRRRGLALDHDSRFCVGLLAWDVPDAAATITAVGQGVGAVAHRLKQPRRVALTVRTWTSRHSKRGAAALSLPPVHRNRGTGPEPGERLASAPQEPQNQSNDSGDTHEAQDRRDRHLR